MGAGAILKSMAKPGHPPPFTGTLAVGKHRIRVYRDDLGYDLTQTVTIKRDTTLPVSSP